MSIVFEPPQQHSCGPNSYGNMMARQWDPPGTVWACDCGRTWVAFKDPYPGHLATRWRPEGGFERWRRERRARKLERR
jgi:hypothetical protein